jgi:hypothetical protein
VNPARTSVSGGNFWADGRLPCDAAFDDADARHIRRRRR